MFALKKLTKLTKTQFPVSFLQFSKTQRFTPYYNPPFALFSNEKDSKSENLSGSKTKEELSKEQSSQSSNINKETSQGDNMTSKIKSMGKTIRESARGVAQTVTEKFGRGLGHMTDYKGEAVRPDLSSESQRTESFRGESQGVSNEDYLKEIEKEVGPGPKPSDMRKSVGMASSTMQTKETSTYPGKVPGNVEKTMANEELLRQGNESVLQPGGTEEKLTEEEKEMLRGGQMETEWDQNLKETYVKEKGQAVGNTEKVIELADDWDWNLLERSTKPVIVDFYKPYDSESRRVHSKLVDKFQDQSDWALAAANIDKLQTLAKKMEVESVPTFFLIHQGRVVEKVSGGENLDKIIEKANDLGRQNYGPGA